MITDHLKRAWARYLAWSSAAAVFVNDFLAAAGEGEVSIRAAIAGVAAIAISAWEDIRNTVKDGA